MGLKLCPMVWANSLHNPLHKYSEVCLTCGEIFLPPLIPSRLFVNISDFIFISSRLNYSWPVCTFLFTSKWWETFFAQSARGFLTVNSKKSKMNWTPEMSL